MVELVFNKVAEAIICHFAKSLHSLTPPKHYCVVEYGLHHRYDTNFFEEGKELRGPIADSRGPSSGTERRGSKKQMSYQKKG